jgi:hypothetical protein
MKNFKKALTAALSILLVLTVLSSCSSKVASSPETYTTSAATTRNQMMEYDGSSGKMDVAFSEDSASNEKGALYSKAESEQQSGIIGTGYTGTNVNTGTSLDIIAQRKIIRNANISLEVDDFYKQYGNIQSMINGIGYVQEINTSRQYYSFKDEQRSRITGNIIIRVDAKQFDNIVNGIKGLGDITDDRIYTNDVTDQFFDTEGRLKILKIEYEFLEEYMMSLKDPDSIFKTRMRMTDLQTEIERLSGTLNKWSDLVELSTIYINMTEKYPEDMGKNNNTYWNRLKNAVQNSLTGIVDALGDLVIFIIEAIPTLVILAIIGFTGWRIAKRYIRKKQKEPVSKE